MRHLYFGLNRNITRLAIAIFIVDGYFIGSKSTINKEYMNK